MYRIIVCGANGKAGSFVVAEIGNRRDCTVAAGVDVRSTGREPFPVFSSISDCSVEADCIIDFSHPSQLVPILEYVQKHRIPAVIATTGFSPEQVSEIEAVSKHAPIFFSANMSLGVNLLTALAQKAAEVLGKSFDIEIIEKHHNQKIDAPSGTAYMLADAINKTFGGGMSYIYDRHSVRSARAKNEIGIHSVRGGTIVGEHEVIFAGTDEVISISHAAHSKAVFATGAVNAAIFLAKQGPGLYNMKDLL